MTNFFNFATSFTWINSKQLKKLQEDAARYQYLRDRISSEVIEGRGPEAGAWIDCEDEDGSLTLITGDDADEFIDSQIAKDKHQIEL